MKKLVVIGGSAGSLDVLLQLLPLLPAVQSYAVVVVLHRRSGDDVLLEDLLAVKTLLPVVEVEDKTVLERGKLFVAPPDYHLLFETDGTLSLDASEKVHYSRPSIDVSFESAASAYKNGVTALLLSGANSDGTAGLLSVYGQGGTTLIQDPATASMPYMPQFAMDHVPSALSMDVTQVADYLRRLDGMM